MTAFDEHTYLRMYPDVRLAVAMGHFRSGQDHFERFGRKEGRFASATSSAVATEKMGPAFWVEKLECTPSGNFYVLGWVNDQSDRIICIDFDFSDMSRISISGDEVARFRRTDVENTLSLSIPFEAGFWSFIIGTTPVAPGRCRMTMTTESGAVSYDDPQLVVVDDEALRISVFSHFSQASYLIEQSLGAVASICPLIGHQLAKFNLLLARQAKKSYSVERFGRIDRSYKTSVIIYMYSNPEYLNIQQTLFSRQAGVKDYEFIYVCADPLLAPRAFEEAKISSLFYNIDTTVVTFSEFIGEAAAKNLAAEVAHSERLLFIDLDIFPNGQNYLLYHNDIVAGLPRHKTAIFGAPLTVDNGIVIHGGVYIDLRRELVKRAGQNREVEILQPKPIVGRVTPERLRPFLSSPVPAIAGAFISTERRWFETLGGFSEQYISGHFGCFDLCLRSLVQGTAAWVHNASLYHLEAKVFSRSASQDGQGIVDNWLFTQTWKDAEDASAILGPTPTHLALQAER